jgi:hypothetical protein
VAEHEHTFWEDPPPTGRLSCPCGQLAETVMTGDGEEGIRLIDGKDTPAPG